MSSSAHPQPGAGGDGLERFDDDLVGTPGASAPVAADRREQPVLDPVPFAGARRQVTDGDGQSTLVGQRGEFGLPQPQAGAVGAAAVGGDQQPGGTWVRPTLTPSSRPGAAESSTGPGDSPNSKEPPNKGNRDQHEALNRHTGRQEVPSLCGVGCQVVRLGPSSPRMHVTRDKASSAGRAAPDAAPEGSG